MDIHTVLKNVGELSSRFAAERNERQQRRALVASDFAALCDAGFLLTGVPVEEGGVWQDVRHSARPVCDILRVLASKARGSKRPGGQILKRPGGQIFNL